MTQTHKDRSEPYPYHQRSKIIAKSKYLNILSSHAYLQALKNTYERDVKTDKILLFHYRNTVVANKFPVEDKTAWKYGKVLGPQVDRVCKNVFKDGICPTKQ